MRKVIVFLLLFFVLSVGAFWGISRGIDCNENTETFSSSANFLVLGIDDVGVNTDVMLLVGYQTEKNTLTVMQLPRDTYFELDGHGTRLNQLYASACRSANTNEDALRQTADVIATALQIPIAGAVAFGLETFSDLVNTIGGVPIDIPFDMEYKDEDQNLVIALPKGHTVLDGEKAEQFVRFRSSYVQGDVGRLDAQKLFMASFLDKVFNHTEALDIFGVFVRNRDKITITPDSKNLIKFAADAVQVFKKCSIAFLTVPGEALYMPDLGWCYAINRAAVCDVLNNYFAVTHIRPSEFDTNGTFCAEGNTTFETVYHSGGFEYQIYTPNNTNEIKIVKKE